MTDRDASDLASMGHGQALPRSFSPLSMLALSFSVLGTWSTCAQNLGLGLTTGGPISIVWGMLLVAICNTCVAMSLGELVSSMPTALGQAYWVSRLLGQDKPADATLHVWRWDRFTAYMCAWINTFGWWTLVTSQTAFMSEFTLALHRLKNMPWLPDPDRDESFQLRFILSRPDFEFSSGLRFGVYLTMAVASALFNHVASRHPRALPMFNSIVGIWFALEFLLFSTALPVSVSLKSKLNFQTAKWVFTGWINTSDWPDGFVFCLGLVQGAYGLTAFDTVIHMVEELPAPRRNAPRTMCLAVILGAATGLFFMIVCLFCLQSSDLARIKDNPSGLYPPFIVILTSTLGVSLASVFVGFFIGNGLGQGISAQTSASRLTWSFARDGGIPYGQSYFANVDDRWHAPIRALWLQTGVVSLVGLLYFINHGVLTAVLSVSTIALTLSYGIPIAVLMYVGRDKLPPGGQFNLGPYFGPVVNTISLVYCSLTTVIFFFPGDPGDMNGAGPVFGVMLVVSIGFWCVRANKTFLTHMADQDSQLLSTQRSSFSGSAPFKVTHTPTPQTPPHSEAASSAQEADDAEATPAQSHGVVHSSDGARTNERQFL